MNQIVRVRRLRAVLFLALPLAACSVPAPPQRPPLEGARIGGPFTLTDQNGHRVTDQTFAGDYRIVYFGYTFCPDVCPVDAQNIGAGLRLVEKVEPATGRRIVPIFISVDPARDTPTVLKSFVGAFHPRMVGLTGDPSAIAAVAKEFGVFYQKGEPTPGGGYFVQHSRVAYLMNPQGKPIALLPIERTPQAVADEIERWVT